jgi:hypothetical protein
MMTVRTKVLNIKESRLHRSLLAVFCVTSLFLISYPLYISGELQLFLNQFFYPLLVGNTLIWLLLLFFLKKESFTLKSIFAPKNLIFLAFIVAVAILMFYTSNQYQ